VLERATRSFALVHERSRTLKELFVSRRRGGHTRVQALDDVSLRIAPGEAVVFAGEVNARTAADPRVKDLEQRMSAAEGAERAALATELAERRQSVRSEKLNEVAAEFDRVHSIQRAVEVGSVDAVIGAHELRPRLIEAVERGPRQPASL